MPYPTLPPTLAAMDAVKTTPLGTEAANQIDEVLRQTRAWTVDYLSQFFSDSPAGLKAAAFNQSGFPTQFIRGANPTDGSARDIVSKTITKYDIADKAIVTALLDDRVVVTGKLGLAAVQNENIQDAAITGAKVALATLTSAHFQSLGISGSQLAAGSIDNTKYAAASVGSAALAFRAVAGNHLPQGSVGQILVGGNSVNGKNDCFDVKTLSGAFTINAAGIATLSSGVTSNIARIAEQVTANVGGGVPAGTGLWTKRGAGSPTPPWGIITNVGNFIRINGYKIEILFDGPYLIMVSSPAHRCDGHRLRLVAQLDGSNTTTVTQLGTTEYSANGASYAQTRSLLTTILSFVKTDSANKPFFYIEHFTDQIGGGANTLGRPTVTSGTDTEIYADVVIVALR